LGVLDRVNVPLDQKLLVHRNINLIRGDFAKLLLTCQSYEQALAESKVIAAAINGEFQEFYDRHNNQFVSSIDELTSTESTAFLVMLTVVLPMLAGGAIWAFLFASRISRRLSDLTASISRVAKGDVSSNVPYRDDEDE